MNYDEALEWLKGKRSMINLVPYDDQNWQIRIAQADAAMIQQAYWVVRAHREGLLED